MLNVNAVNDCKTSEKREINEQATTETDILSRFLVC